MKATNPKTVIDPWSCRFLIQPRGESSVVQIGKTIYLVKIGMGFDGERFWEFHKSNGAKWTVYVRGLETMHCTCPDRLFRRRDCKHARAVRVLFSVPAVVGDVNLAY